MKNNTIQVSGRVTHLFFADVGFSAGVLTESSGKTHRFAGPFFLQEDDMVVFHGRITNSKYGRQLKIEHFELDIHLDREGLVRFLANDPRFKGIGIVRAREIAEFCGDNFDNIIRNKPNNLLKIRGITPDIIDSLQEEWNRRREHNNAITNLAAYGLTPKQIDKVIEILGQSVIAILDTDPYRLIELIRGLGFVRVDQIAQKIGLPKESPNRIQSGIIHILNGQLSTGNTWMDRSDLAYDANKLLIIDSLESENLINKQIDELIKGCKLVEVSFDNHDVIAIASIYSKESYIRSILSRFRRST